MKKKLFKRVFLFIAIRNMDDLEDLTFSNPEEAEKEEFNRQFDLYTSKFVKAGYRDALEDDESILQESFDHGYSVGYETSLRFNSLRLQTKMIQGMYQEKRLNLEQEKSLQALEEFNQVLDQIYVKIAKFNIDSAQKVVEANSSLDSICDISTLKTQAETILQDLKCPIKPI